MSIEKPKIKLTLKNMRVIATWNYTSENNDCKLCHKDLLDPVEDTITNKINGDVTIGTCKHGFHTTCINTWITKGNISCPLCQTSWKIDKNVGSSVYMYKSTI